MEKINLENYEAYFLDYMEGTLGTEEKMDLFAFLEKHPHLKAEIEEDFGVVELMPSTVTVDFKSELKRTEDEIVITPNTVEDLMIASIEGQLSAKEQTALDAYIKANGLEETMKAFRATRLKPDTQIVYADKKELKQKDTRIIAMPWLIRAGAIAAVGLLLITLALNWGDGTTPAGTTAPVFASDYKTPTDGLNDKNRPTEDIMPDVTDQWSPAQNDQMAYEESPREEEVRPEEEENEGERGDEEMLPFIQETPEEDEFVREEKDKPTIKTEKEKEDEEGPQLPLEEEYINEEDVASVEETPSKDAQSKSEEPYKLVTNAASDLINRDVQFTRERDVASNDYVGFGFKLGKFEFERKKSK